MKRDAEIRFTKRAKPYHKRQRMVLPMLSGFAAAISTVGIPRTEENA